MEHTGLLLTAYATLLLRDEDGSIGHRSVRHFRPGDAPEYSFAASRLVSRCYLDNFRSLIQGSRFLSARPDGTAGFNGHERLGWEKFLEVSEETVLALRHFVGARYYVFNSRNFAGATMPDFDGSGDFHLGGQTFPIQENIEAIVRFYRERAKNIVLVKDGWKTFAFESIRPVIYYCAFGSAEQVELVKISIQSCLEFGRYEGDFVILTDLEEECRREILPICDRVILRSSRLDGVYQFKQARYSIAEHPEFSAYSPILYLDTDVMVDAPIAGTLLQILAVEKVSVYFEGCSVEDRDSLGRTLLRKDGIETTSRRGINSGILGFSSIETAFPFLAMVMSTIDQYIHYGPRNEVFNFLDQSITNYVLHKHDYLDTNAFQGRVRTYWHGVFEDGDRPMGFCHFTSRPKLPGMVEYLADLSGHGERLAAA